MVNREGIAIATRITPDDGGPLDKEHIDIVSTLRDKGVQLQEVSKKLRICARPATIVKVGD